MLVNADITIYNRRYNKKTRLDEWHRTVIQGVHFYVDNKAALTDGGLKSANIYKIRIPDNSKCDKQYLEETEYSLALDVSNNWTIQKDDYVLKGISDKETEKPSNLINGIKITSWADNRFGGLPHFRIGGE